MIGLLAVLQNPIGLLAPSQMRPEAELVIRAVETLHPEAARWQGRGRLRWQAQELNKEAELAGDTSTWFRAISRYLAEVRSEATYARWPIAVEARLFRYPTGWTFEGVREIEGRRIGDLQRNLAPWISVEGRTDDSKDGRFAEMLPKFEPIWWGLKADHRLVMTSGKEGVVTGLLSAPPSDAVTFERKPGQVAYLRVRNWDDAEAALEPILEGLRRDGNLRLVLDLRDCHGSRVDEAAQLFRLLSPMERAFADRITARALELPVDLASLGTMPVRFRPGNFEAASDGTLNLKREAARAWLEPLPGPKFGGRVDVLIGPGTGAVGAYLAAQLRYPGKVRVIGTTASGYANGFCGGESVEIRLPTSGIRIQVPLLRFNGPAKGPERVLPDIRVAKDALGWAIAHPPLPSGG